MFGVLYGVLIFVGFETAANLAEETAEPKRSIPRAVLGAVVLVSIFYVIAAYVEVAGFGFDMAVITSPEVAGAPLFALGAPGGQFGSEFWLKLLMVVVFLDMLAVYVGAGVASTRGVFAMARDRRLPAPLASVSSRFGTPSGAIFLLIAMQALFIYLAEWTEVFGLEGLPHYFALFAWASTFGGFALLVVYLMMSVGAFATLGKQDEAAGRRDRGAWWASRSTGAAIWGSFYKVPSPTIWAPRYALIWLVIGRDLHDLGQGSRAREPGARRPVGKGDVAG